MRPKSVTKEEDSNLLPSMNDQGLRRAVSDVSTDIDKLMKDYGAMVKINQVKRAECECCGFVQDCTPDYIEHVRDSHSGKWVCGICSEAVKERLTKGPRTAIEEAVRSHMEFCQKFNKTTRLNPKLSLAWTMREIANRSSQHRNSSNLSTSKIARSHSCVPKIDPT